MMDDWLKWAANLFWQPSRDERQTRIEAEVAEIRCTIADLKQRTEALEALHRLAGDAR
jgi:hypothetical protein